MCFLSPLVISCCGIMVFIYNLCFCYNVPYIPYFNARKAEER